MNDRARFTSNMMTLCTVFNREMEMVLLDAWWRACETLNDGQFERSLDELTKECTYFPTPAQVRAQAYRMHEEKQNGYAGASGIPGVALLEPGPMVDAARAEGQKYASQHLYDSGHIVPLFACLTCRDRHFVRVEVMVTAPHFGASIPCPDCRGDAYERYAGKHGVPPGLPKWGA